MVAHDGCYPLPFRSKPVRVRTFLTSGYPKARLPDTRSAKYSKTYPFDKNFVISYYFSRYPINRQRRMTVTINMNPRTQGIVHPEQGPFEFFLGNFDLKFAKEKLPWKTKRAGSISLMKNGEPYPQAILPKYHPVPVFVLRTEILQYHYKILYGK